MTLPENPSINDDVQCVEKHDDYSKGKDEPRRINRVCVAGGNHHDKLTDTSSFPGYKT